MKEEILHNLEKPRQLEKLYRDNKAIFRKAFNQLYPDIQEKPIAQTWNERLNFDSKEISWGTTRELVFIIAAVFLAGLLAIIPALTTIKADNFYQRNIAFIVFPFLSTYFLWSQKTSFTRIAVFLSVFAISALYINLLPDNNKSDTLILACIHLPLFLWAVTGFSFVGDNYKNNSRRLDFLRFNGDLVVMTAILIIAGAILTGVTFKLFSLVDLRIKEFYSRYVIVWGLAAAPIIGTYLVRTNPQLVNKVSPVVAKVFTPLVLVTLVAYLITVILTDKNPYNDREFLLVFNVLLLGVMAIVLFSIAETSVGAKSKTAIVLLLALSMVTLIVNGIALSAILFRINEWGLTPNRLAVLGGNVLILSNLVMVTYRLYRVVLGKDAVEKVTNSIAVFLPIYMMWTAIVTFMLPLIFNFK